MMYWPLINMLSWGFSSLYIVKKLTGVTVIAGTFVGGVLLNEIFMRTTMTILVLFLEEIWSRNLGHLFASPLKLLNYSIGPDHDRADPHDNKRDPGHDRCLLFVRFFHS